MRASFLAKQVLEGASPQEVMRQYGGREIIIRRDASHEKYFQIPIPTSTWDRQRVVLFKPITTNPVLEFRKKLEHLVRTKKGYHVGDLFSTPYGKFQITDVNTVKEV